MIPPTPHRVIVHYQNGLILKGHVVDFLPGKGRFHLHPADSCPGTRPTEVRIPDLKGVFFVRRLDGNPAHMERNVFNPHNITPGRKIRVEFNDGEVIMGLAMGYRPDRAGFFMMPADERSNNERCYVVAAATREISLL